MRCRFIFANTIIAPLHINKKPRWGAGLRVSKQTARDGLKAYQHRAVIMNMVMMVVKRHDSKTSKLGLGVSITRACELVNNLLYNSGVSK